MRAVKGAAFNGARSILPLAALVVVIAGLKLAAPLMRPFLAALFLTILGLPLLSTFKRLRCSNGFAVLLTMLALIAVLAGLGILVGGSINDFIADIPKYRVGLQQLFTRFIEWLATRGIDARELALENIQPGAIFDIAGAALRGLGGLFVNVLLVLIVTLFLMGEVACFPEKLRLAIGPGSQAMERLAKIRQEVQRYLVIKTLVSVVTGILAGSWCALLGVEYPLLWGLVAFTLNYIPNLGSIIAAIPPVILAMIQFGPGRGLFVALGYLTINIALGSFLEPHFMGRRLGISTFVVFFSLVFWGWVWGPLGMLLSVPLTMILKIMLENTEDLRWIAVLIGPRPGGLRDAASPASVPSASGAPLPR